MEKETAGVTQWSDGSVEVTDWGSSVAQKQEGGLFTNNFPPLLLRNISKSHSNWPRDPSCGYELQLHL